MAVKFDLLGDPIPDNHGEVGRTGYVATSENANKIRLLVVAGWTQKEIANELGMTIPTLRKHYFLSLKRGAEIAVSEVRGRVMLQLSKAAEKGNVAAMKELLKQAEKAEVALLSSQAKNVGQGAKPKPLGKKAQEKLDATTAASSGQGMAANLPNYAQTKH